MDSLSEYDTNIPQNGQTPVDYSHFLAVSKSRELLRSPISQVRERTPENRLQTPLCLTVRASNSAWLEDGLQDLRRPVTHGVSSQGGVELEDVFSACEETL